MIKSSAISILYCALSTVDDRHICENAVMTPCGHFICKSCIRTNEIQCLKCNQMQKLDLNQQPESKSFNVLLTENLNQLFGAMCDKFKISLMKSNQFFNNFDQNIENRIQFIREEIQIVIESIKIKLEQFYESFNQELNEIETNLKKENKKMDATHKINESWFNNDLNNLEQCIKNQDGLTRENLYKFQNKLKSFNETLNDYLNRKPELSFKESSITIEKVVVGELVFEEEKQFLVNVLGNVETNKCDRIEINAHIHDVCVLPNGNFLMANFDNANLLLFDSNMFLIKTIESINNYSFRIVCVATDGESSIYMNDCINNYVFKTDFEFNQLAAYGYQSDTALFQVNNPRGLCYYDQHVYVCDFANKRIQKLDSNLNYKTSIDTSYYPWYIKNIKNIAMVRPSSHEASIYFYDLNTLSLIRKYDGHNGVIGLSDSWFFEYYSENKTFYCYNKNGNLCKSIQTNVQGTISSNNWGCIFKSKSKLYLSIHDKPFLTVI